MGTAMGTNKIQTKETFSKYYEVTDKCLGGGASGVVKIVTCKATNKEYALKTLKSKNAKQIESAEEEIHAHVVGCGHENIVQMKEVFREGSLHYIVMEKLGQDLLKYCLEKGPMSENKAARVVRDVANALELFHKMDVAHRDVKLENIFCSNDNLFPIKLGDFGLNSGFSRKPCCNNHGRQLMSSRDGTIDYIAPEVASIFIGEKVHYDKQCDIWSLGVVLYAMLFNQMPFTPDVHCKDCADDYTCSDCSYVILNAIRRRCFEVNEKWNSISHEAKDLLLKLLEKNPQKRYTASQVLEHPWIISHQVRICK